MKKKIEKDNIYNTKEQMEVRVELGDFFDDSQGTSEEKLEAFPKFITRQNMSLFLARYEIFKKIKEVKGSIIECGVYYGNGLMTYAQLSAALEPINYNRRIVGFDTFEGNKSSSSKDMPSKNNNIQCQPEYSIDTQNEIMECAKIHDRNRFLNHIPKVELVKGDIIETAPKYIEDNPHTLVSLLELTVNLYEPTKSALEAFLPRMCKGSIIAFNTLNEGVFPGVTKALLNQLNLKDYEISSFDYCPNLSYIIL
ncbi:TylF/MycF family methyltransferase [Clostridium tagluense]|uniref:TylF/MycF family methyltransferase n=1 Tax=Clostridium tagluense TaxID=360422 RepID=UPI001C0B7F75|nr:TylF/MycF family methyltransferase [Clostridium tagluense]MBU3126668.1 TylF/MycF family methyltransferase [Clostridium tagluense]